MEFSGMVVTYNDRRRLADCLKSLQFCSELLVIDLGSTDDCIDIANAYGAHVIHHKRVPIIEEIRDYAISLVKHDWIVFPDPDEVFPNRVITKINLITEKNTNVGMIELPWRFYFFGKPITCTIWGRPNKFKSVLFHKKRVTFYKDVHKGPRVIESFDIVKLPDDEGNIIKHYWIDSCRQLFEKHWRYIRLEGEARYKAGERFSWRYWLKETLKTLYMNLFKYNGIRGGWRGIFLSFFHMWYISMSLLSLRNYQRKNKQETYLKGSICG